MRTRAFAIAARLFRATLARSAAQSLRVAANVGAVVGVLLGAAVAVAQFVPSGLQPGDHYHLAFVTSFTTGIVSDTSVPPPFYPSFGGVAAADFIVTNTAASAGNIPGWNGVDQIWKAILSTSTVAARDHVNVQGPVYNTRGELVATGAADLWDGTIAHAIQYDEAGGDIFSGFSVWTGTNKSGLAAGATCGGNWNDPTKTALAGKLTASNSQWLQNTIPGCFNALRLYGISPLLTVPQPGDYNGDGVADAADYVTWRHRNGPSADYDLWRAHFGESINPGAGSAANVAVPEPTAVALLLLAVAFCAARTIRAPLRKASASRLTRG